MIIQAYSTKGLKKKNQDYFQLCTEHNRNLLGGPKNKEICIEESIGICVCDGVSASKNSLDASRLASVLFTFDCFEEDLLYLTERINSIICSLDFKPGDYAPATTIVAGVIINHTLYYVNAGDSKLILIKNDGEVLQLSVDHVLLKEDQTLSHVLTSCLGSSNLTVNVGQIELDINDVLLFATDGLFDGLSLKEIASLIQDTSLKEMADQAIVQGSRDNITMVRILVEEA